MNRVSIGVVKMADEDNIDQKSEVGDSGQAAKPVVKKTAKKKVAKKVAKKTAKKTAKKKTSAKKTAKKKVVKKASTAPAETTPPAPKPEPTPEPPKLGPIPAPAPEPAVPVEEADPVPKSHGDVQVHLHTMEVQEKEEASMESSTKSAPTATHSFWPKVIVLVVLIISGFLYIRSVAKHGDEASGHAAQAPVAERQAASHVALESGGRAATAAESQVQDPIETVQTFEAVPATEVVQVADEQPVAEPQIQTAPAEPQSTLPAPALSVVPESVPAVAQDVATEATAESARAAVPAAAAPVEVAEAAPTDEPAQAAVVAPALAEPAAPAPASPEPQGLPAKSHKQLMEEYQAMRKAAEEEWRRMWGGRQRQQPGNQYYGNPYYRN